MPPPRLWRPDFPFAPARLPLFYGWVIVAAATIGITASIPAQTMGMGVFTDALIDALALDRVAISLTYLIGTLASGLLIPLGGRLLDRWGARRFAVASAAALGCSLFFLALCDQIAATIAGPDPSHARWVATFCLLSLGFFLARFWGQGMLTLSCRNMIGKWFHHRRGIAVGISGVATALLFSASPAFLAMLVDALGWRLAWAALGLTLLVGISSLAWALFRDNPEECGLSMDGSYAPPAGREEIADLTIYRDFTRAEALRTLSFWIFTLSFAWHSLFVTAYTFHVVSIGGSMGMAKQEVLRLFLFASLFAITSNLLAGWASSRIKVKHLLCLMNAMGALFALSPLLPSPALQKVAIVISMGVGGGLWGNLSGLVFPRFFGRSHLGAITGVFMATVIYASAIGPYLFSLLHDAHGDYRLAFALSAIIPALLCCAAPLAENPQRRLRPDQGH